jgi:adenylate kinase family enzyme/uncharacterized protein YecT (DUF1311 family)
MGPPLSGKSTVGARLASSLGGALLSTGAVIREHLASATADDLLAQHVKNGTLAPAALTDDVLLAAFRKLAADESVRAIVVDGYPRAPDQIAEAAALFARAGLAPISTAVLLEIDKGAALARLAGRPARPDDAVALARFERFAADSAALVAHFHARDLLVRVDARGSPDDVFSDVLSAVKAHQLGVAPELRTPATRLRDLLVAQNGVVSDAQLTHFRDSSLSENERNRTGALRRFVYVATGNATKLSEATAMFAVYGLETLAAPHLSAAEWIALAAKGPRADLLAAARAAKLPPLDPQSTLGGDAPASAVAALEIASDDALVTGAQLEALFVRQLLMCRDLQTKIPFALLRENSELLSPNLDRPSPMTHGTRAVNRATLRVWRRIPETKLTLIETFVSTTDGTIDCDKKQNSADVFGWDDVFCPDGVGGLSFHELKRRGLKVAARQVDIATFLSTYVHYSEGKDLQHTPQHPKRCVDFDLDAALVMGANDFVRDPVLIKTGASALAQVALNGGAYLRYAWNRRHANYFLTPVAGLPATPKDDAIHEFVFQTHDLGHLVIQELLFDGAHDSFAHRTCFIAVRMLSEAMTMVAADMLVVDCMLAAKRVGGPAARLMPDDYDWNKRRIYPLFKATGLKLADAATQQEREENLFRLMQANADCLLKGDDSAYLALIQQAGGDVAALAAFKQKYVPFFVSDFEWCLKNYDVLRSTADAQRRWWTSTAPLRAASRLSFESTDAFLKALPLPSRVEHVDQLAPSDLIDTVLRFLFDRQLASAFGDAAVQRTRQRAAAAAPSTAVDLELLPFWLRNALAFTRYLVGQLALFAHFSFVESSAAAKSQVEAIGLCVIQQAWAWHDLADGRTDESARLSWLLARIGDARQLVEAFLRELVARHFISRVDEETYREQFPLFAVNYLTYDADPDSYQSLRGIFEREFDPAVRLQRLSAEYHRVNGLRSLTKTEARFIERHAVLVEAAGGMIDQSTFVMRPGVVMLARSVSHDSSLGGGGCDDPRTIGATFLIAGASIETALEFVAHGEARVARVTSSRTAAMRHALVRILPDADAEAQKAYHLALRSLRQKLRQQLRQPPSAWVAQDDAAGTAGRGAEEIDNSADTAAKATAFVITMTVRDWHKTLVGRVSRDGNESDVVRIASQIADELHALYPAHVWPREKYAKSHNSAKYAPATLSPLPTALVAPATGVVCELQLTSNARRLFDSLHLAAANASDTHRLAEFCMRITYLSFPDDANYNAREWLGGIVAKTGHLSVVGCSRVNLVLPPMDAAARAFLTQQATLHQGGVVTALADDFLHLSFDVKTWAAVIKAANHTALADLVGALREHLHNFSDFFLPN